MDPLRLRLLASLACLHEEFDMVLEAGPSKETTHTAIGGIEPEMATNSSSVQCFQDLLLQVHIITQPDTPVLLDDALLKTKPIQCFR